MDGSHSCKPPCHPDQLPEVRYVLRLADSCLILAQRLGEWCGHAPALEEDIALTNMALDLIGQSRALLYPGWPAQGQGRDEDQLAFLRDERDYLNLTLVELPNSLRGARTGRGDFAFRCCAISSWQPCSSSCGSVC